MAFAGSERFELRRQLGRGGMGVVYEAYDHIRGMRVALKTLRRLDANGLLRFKREFRALNNLSHPNIIHLYELISAGRDWFFTMEFIDGQDLVSYVRGLEPLPPIPFTPSGIGALHRARTPDGLPDPESPEQVVPREPGIAWTTILDPADIDSMRNDAAAGAAGPHAAAAASAESRTPTRHGAGMAAARAGEPSAPVWPDGSGGVPGAIIDDSPALDDLVDLARLWGAMGQLAGALHALHAAAMVHCDLKPSNVMVTREGRVVLMDFGVVAATRGAHDLVRLSEAEGTPAFMAPEQARGEPPGAAADWYAFGATLYLLLAGRLPFESDAMQILLDKQEIDPLPPSTFTQGIPPALEALCMRLLAREPAARPRGEEVLAALGVHQRDGRPARRVDTVMPVDSDLFVGREPELAVLRQSYEAVCARQTRCVLVDGPSGMGKSSLLRHFVQELRASSMPPLVLTGRCRERESLAYKAFDGLIDQLSLHLQDMPVRQRRAILPEGAALLARLFPVLRRVKELDVTIQLSGGMELRLQAVRILRALLGALAREQPIVACVDDLQWADRDSFELLRGVLAAPAPSGFLLLATVRAEALGPDSQPDLDQLMSALATQQAGHRITLGPLSTDERTTLVARLGARGLRVAIDETLVQESAGHPMLLAELVRYAEGDPDELADVGALHLEDVIWRRAVRLPEAARALVEAVAVAGEPTPLGILAEAAALSPVDRERALSVLHTGHLVRVTRTGAEPWLDAYHDKVREALVERMPAERVRALHGRLAQAMEPWDEAPTASLARHWLAAGEHDRAAAYLLRAARGASEQLAFDRAAALYRSVADLLAGLPSEPARDRRRCQAWLGLAQGMRLADRTDEALALLERAQAAATAHGWLEELADIHYLRGNLIFPRNDLDGCLAEHARAYAYAREVGSPRREASALSGLGDAHYMRGQLAAAREHYARCIDLCRAHGFEDIEAANLPMRGLMHFYYNEHEAALRDGAASMALASRIGHARAEVTAICICLGRVWCELGWVDSARPELERARTLARSLGARRYEAMSLILLARLVGQRGHGEAAEALIAEGMAVLGEADRSYVYTTALGTRALVTRDAELRARCMAEIEALVTRGATSSSVLYFHRDAIELALAAGDWDRAEQHARALEEYTRDEPLSWSWFYVERARVLAAHGRGRRDPEMVARLQRLFREASATGFHVAAEALGQALAESMAS